MFLQEDYEGPENIFYRIIVGLEKWCIEFNKFSVVFFIYLKFIFVFIMLSIGMLTLLKLRGIYLQTRKAKIEPDEDKLKTPRLALGSIYIFFAIGILFNYLIYFLIWILDPLPDRMIFNFLDLSSDIDPHYMNRIEDIEKCKFPHEKTIYYCIAYASFFFTLNLILSIWYLINNNKVISNPRKVILNLFFSLTGAIIFGFTTYLPLFL